MSAQDSQMIKELQQLVVQQKSEIDMKAKEIEQMHQIYNEFKNESQQLEDVLQKQTDMYEKQLQSTELQLQLIETNAAQQLVKTKTKYLTEIQGLDKQVETLKTAVYLLKQQLASNGIEPKIDDENNSIKDQETKEENSMNDISKENVLKLNLELKEKNKIIEELKTQLNTNKDSLKNQCSLFQEFTKDMEQNQERQESQVKLLKENHKKEIEMMANKLQAQEEINSELNHTASNEKEVDALRELVKVQGTKLKQLAKDFVEYKAGAEKLLESETFIRDEEISKLKIQLSAAAGLDDVN